MQRGGPALWTIAVSFALSLRWQVTNYSLIKSTLEPQPGVPRPIEEGENKLSGGPCPLNGRGLQCPPHQIYPELRTGAQRDNIQGEAL